MWATLYNRVGVVKRHVDQRRFCFSLRRGFCPGSLLIDQGPLAESRGGPFGSTSHLFGHL